MKIFGPLQENHMNRERDERLRERERDRVREMRGDESYEREPERER